MLPSVRMLPLISSTMRHSKRFELSLGVVQEPLPRLMSDWQT